MSYLVWSCGSATDAEDLFQEVCLSLHGNWEKVSEMDRPDAWAIRVAHNRSVNRFKRRAAERRAMQERRTDAEATPQAGADDAPSVAGRLDAPAAALHRQELELAVRKALVSLPVHQREAVSQKIHGGLSWLEIGRNLGVSDDTAARLFARGLRKLAPLLKGFWHTPDAGRTTT